MKNRNKKTREILSSKEHRGLFGRHKTKSKIVFGQAKANLMSFQLFISLDEKTKLLRKLICFLWLTIRITQQIDNLEGRTTKRDKKRKIPSTSE